MNPGNCVFQSAVCVENHTGFACYIFDTHHLSICRPLSPPAVRRTVQCSPVLRQQRTPSGMRRTLAKSRRSGAMSRFFALLGAYRRSFCKLTGDATVKTFSFEKKTKSTACCGNFGSTSRSVVFERRYIQHD